MWLKFILITALIISTLSAPAIAQDFRDEGIWTHQGTFVLGVDERGYAGDYTVKVHEIDMEERTALLLIYRKNVYQDSLFTDTDIHREQVFDDTLKVNILDIDDEKVTFDLHIYEYGRLWLNDIPRTSMKPGDEITTGNCVVKITDLIGDQVWITVSKGKERITDGYKVRDSKKYFDEIMVKLVYLKGDEAFLEIYRPGSPSIGLEITGLEETYDPNEIIEYDVVISNNGSIPLRNIFLEMDNDICDPEKEEYRHQRIEPGKSKTFHVKIDPPAYAEAEKILIEADVKGYDFVDTEYSADAFARTSVNSYIRLEKSITPGQVQLSKLSGSKQQEFLVELEIHNMADSSRSVNVRDSIHESFLLADLKDLEWTVTVGANSTQTISYKAIPTKVGTFDISHATARWEDSGTSYSAYSTEPDTLVNVGGASIVATKRLSSDSIRPGESVDVMVIISNYGDTVADIGFSDSLPYGVELISGAMELETQVYPHETTQMKYTIKPETTGILQLPELEVFFAVPEGEINSVNSDPVNLYIGTDQETASEEYSQQPSETIEEENTGSKQDLTRWGIASSMTSSFMAILAILGIFPLSAYILINRKN